MEEKKYPTAKEMIRERIGAARAEKYREIEPLLALIEYRFDDAGKRMEYGITRLLQLDTLWGKKTVSKVLGFLVTPVLWAATRVKAAGRKKAGKRLVFSNQFIFNKRYPVVREQVENRYGCTEVCAFYDTIKRTSPNAKEMLRETLRLDAGKVKPVFIPRWSIAGGALQRAVMEYYRMLQKTTFDGAAMNDEELDALLERLRRTYQRRLEWMKKRLAKENIRLYITVNQYNLRDLMMIHACRDIGAETLEQEHHAMQFCGMQFDPEHPRPRLSFVRNYGLWTETDRLFHERVFFYDNVLYKPEENRFIVSGNTEMAYDEAKKFREQYPAQRKLTFMTAAFEDTDFNTKEELESYTKWRRALFAALRELSERQKIPIRIRYTPYSETYFREREIPVLKEWGFEISESIPENLMEDMCSSSAIMSSTSSVLATARLFGKLTFRVENGIVDYLHVDDEIHEVTVETIPEIVIPERREEKIDPEGFFDIDRIMKAL